MRVIAKKKLVDFYETPNMDRSRTSLLAWFKIVSCADWTDFADVKQTFGASVDIVGDCVVFDISGNHFRMVTRLRFLSHKVFVLKIMTHKEYDRDKWKEDCGCFAEPPARKAESVSIRKKETD